MALVLDIETVGQLVEEIPERALDYLYRSLERDGPEPDELAKRREELVERFGLDPTTGRIVCIGTYDTEAGREQAFYEGSEKDLLSAFWSALAVWAPSTIVTFNGKRFDVPYLIVRSAIHGLEPTTVITPGRHFDVRQALEGDDRRRRGSLDFFCSIFGVASPKIAMDGAGVGAAYAEGRLEDIVRYCLADCRATAALYTRLRPFFP